MAKMGDKEIEYQVTQAGDKWVISEYSSPEQYKKK